MEGNRRLANRVPARLSVTEGRRFGLTVGGAFLLFAVIAWWRGRSVPAGVFAALGFGLTLAGLILPTRLGPIERAWMAGARAISRVTTPIMVSVVYIFVITPMGLAMRALGKNPLKRREHAAGFWVERSGESETPGKMERQF